MLALAVFLSATSCSFRTYAQTTPSCENVQRHKNYALLAKPSECLPLDSIPRIMGGRSARLGEFPWLVLIYLTNPFLGLKLKWCAGSILSKKYVLTAAHCVPPDLVQLYNFTVHVGEYNLDNAQDCDESICAPLPVDYDAEEYFSYPNYDQITNQNDLGLIRVKGEISFNDFVHPACLPTSCSMINDNLVGKYTVVAGWGSLVDVPKSVESHVLQKVQVPVVPQSVCNKDYGKVLSEGQMCVGGSERGELGKDACHGDSGGPLMYLNPHQYYLVVGIVSGGQDCDDDASEQAGGLYTRVATYLLWILDNIRK